MKTILCTTDFSLNANHAFQYCLAFAEKIKARVLLLHAWESSVMFTSIPMTAVYDTDLQICDVSEKKLTAMKKKAKEKFPSVDIEIIMERGLASDCIVKCADKFSVDLIVTGATGAGKVESFFVGSTAAAVIQHANCTVLCVPKGIKFHEFRKIVFATDLHEDNLDAATQLATFAKLFHAEVVFLFVDDKHIIHSDEDITEMTQKIREHVKHHKISGYVCKNTNITDGIEYFLKHNPADMLAMFTHKKKLPERIFHPSLTKIMANKTSLPFLVLERSEREVLA